MSLSDPDCPTPCRCGEIVELHDMITCRECDAMVCKECAEDDGEGYICEHCEDSMQND